MTTKRVQTFSERADKTVAHSVVESNSRQRAMIVPIVAILFVLGVYKMLQGETLMIRKTLKQCVPSL